MRTQLRKERGFTLIELLVVIAIIALLAAILFPVFAKAQAKAKQTQCMSNMRSLTQAMMMFVQDNKGVYPDISGTVTTATTTGDITKSWAGQLDTYAGNRKIFTCPADPNNTGYVSYVINGALFNPDGTGINSSAVTNPVEVGMFTDGTSYKFPDAGVLNWGGDSLVPTHNNKASLAVTDRHSYNMTYADGHAESVNGSIANTNVDSINSPVQNAFYGAAGFGWVNNPGAGVVTIPSTSANSTDIPGNFTDAGSGSFTIAGSTTCQPIWNAAVAGWTAMNGATPTVTLTGSFDAQQGDLGGRSSYSATFASASTDIIAKDAVAVVVSSTSRLGIKSLTPAQVQHIFMGATNAASTEVPGLGSNILHVYSRCTASDGYTETIEGGTDAGSGTAKFIGTWTGLAWSGANVFPDGATRASSGMKNGVALTTADPANETWTSNNSTVTPVISTASMLTHVGSDPYGIGYCSVGEADPTKVTILAITTSTGNTQTFDRAAVEATNPKFDSTIGSGNTNNKGCWSLTRYLYASTTGVTPPAAGDNVAATAFLNYVKCSDFQKSLLFKSSFFPIGSPQ